MKKGSIKALLLGVTITATVGLCACGSSGYTGAGYAEESAVESAYDAKGYNAYETMDAEAAIVPDESVEVSEQTNRKLITTVNLSTETESLDKTMAQIENKTKELGGYIENSSIYNGSNYSSYRESRSASYTIRIPADKLDLFIESVEEGTNITNKSVNVDDVTLQYVDIESKKKALKTEEQRLLEILEKAETVEDIIKVEERLSDVRYELESIESQLRTYDNKVDYSTVYMDISEVEQYTPAEKKGVIQRIAEGFVYNFKEVINALVEIFIWIVIHIPQIIILLLVCVASVFGCRAYVSSRKKKREMKMRAYMQAQGQAQPQVQPQGQTMAGQVNTQGNDNGNK